MINKKFNNQYSDLTPEGQKIVEWAQNKKELIADLYENLNFAKAMVEIREIADKANKYFDEKTPWTLIKENPEETQKILTDILCLFLIMTIYLKPILPVYAKKVEKLFKLEELQWDDIDKALTERSQERTLNNFEHLSQRVDAANIEKLIEDSKVV